MLIPDRPAFKASEVCEIAQIKPYVLRSWESEFPDLGLSKTPGGPRVYRRSDVERVLRIRELVFTEGLTLSGVRRRFESEQPQPQEDLFSLVAELQAAQAAQAATAPPAPPRPVATAASAVAAPPGEVSEAPSATAAAAVAPAVDEATREQIGKLRTEMRSLLELLGGGQVQSRPAGGGGIGAPMDPARKRSKR